MDAWRRASPVGFSVRAVRARPHDHGRPPTAYCHAQPFWGSYSGRVAQEGPPLPCGGLWRGSYGRWEAFERAGGLRDENAWRPI